jgi:polyribonucleotide nucleotidyltransferase
MQGAAALDLIRQHLRTKASEIDALRIDTKRLDEKFVQLRGHPPPRPSVPRDKIDSDIARLEHRRTTTSMSLSAEKKLLKEIEKIASMRKAHSAVDAHNTTLDDIRANKDAAFDRLRELRSIVADLQKAEAKLLVCERLGGVVQPSELVETSVSLEGNADKIGAIVGKGGNTLRQKESEYGVSIDIDRKENAVNLMGTPDGVAKAGQWIQNVFDAIEVEVAVTDEVLRLLVLRKGERLKRLESDFGLRVNLNRDELKLVARGGAKSIKGMERTIKEWVNAAVAVGVPAQLLPRLVGKKGAVVKAFEQEHGVDVQIDRENEVFVLHGDADNLARARAALEAAVEENTEHEKLYELKPGMVPALIGKGGGTIQKIQKESSTYINIDRQSKQSRRRRRNKGGEDDEVPAEPAGDGIDKIVVKGTTAALAKADELIHAFFAQFEKENQVLEFDPSLASMVVGKKGETVTGIQKENEVSIDVDRDSGKIVVRGEEENVLNAVAALKAVLDSYKAIRLNGSSDELGSIIGKSGATIQGLTKDSGAQIKVDRKTGTIDISGPADNVAKAKDAVEALLEKFRRENVSIELDADFIPSLIGKGGENIKQLREEMGVQIDLGPRGSGAVVLRGDEDKLGPAKEKLVELAERYKKENVMVRIRPDAYSALIGKGGKNIQKLQADTNTQIDVRREKNEVFIRGKDEESVKQAVQLVTEIAGESDDVISLDIGLEPNTNAAAVIVGKKGSQVMKLQQDFRVTLNIDRDADKVVVRGMSDDVARAKIEIERLLKENVRITKDLIIPESAVAEIIGKRGANIQKLTSSTGAFIDVLRPDDDRNPSKKNEHVVRIRGTTDAVAQAFVSIQAIAGMMEDGEMLVAPHHMELLNKQKNLKLARVQQKLGVQIVLDGEAGTVTFHGGSDGDSQGAAKSEVKALLQFFFPKEFSRYAMKPEVFSATFPRGETGAKLSELAEDSNGATFELDRNTRVIHVMGDESQVALAMVKLKSLEEEYRRRVKDVRIPLSAVRAVVGKGGKTIKKLTADTKCKFDIIRGQGSATVRIVGDPDRLQGGADAVGAIVEQFKKENVEMSFDPDAASIIIGAKGATIRKLQADNGCRIDLADKGRGVLTIQGKADAIEKTKAAIKALLEANGYADDVQTVDVEVHPQDIPSIIGRAGVTIRQIEANSGARVSANKENGSVSIRGRPGEVEVARNEVTAIVEKNRAERDAIMQERRKEQQNDNANEGETNAANDDDEQVPQKEAVARPAWIPGMSEGDRLQARTASGEIMSKTALKNKQKRERKKASAQSSLAGVESLLLGGESQPPPAPTYSGTRTRRRSKEGPPPGFSPAVARGNSNNDDDEARAALASLGFGLDGLGGLDLDKRNDAPTSGMQYSGLGYNLRL